MASASSMKIRSVELRPFRIPLVRPVKFSTGLLTSAEHVLVRVHTDNGVTGVAEAIPRPMIYGETMASTLHAIDHLIAPAIIGLSVLDREQMAHRLRHLAGNPVAKGAVELAVFDALGRALGTSCFRLLGGFQNAVRCTAILGANPPAESAEQALALRESRGITSFKVKVGMDLPQDVARIQALRQALGSEAVIYPDANHGFSAAEALRFLEATAAFGLAWIEEPCPAEDLLARERVCRSSPIPVLGDESCTNTREVATEVLGGRVSMVSIKLARTGIGASVRIRSFCEATGTPVLAGSQGDSSIGTLITAAFAGAAPATARHPAELAYFLELEDEVVTEPVRIQDGMVRVPDAPGFGIEIDEERLRRYGQDY